MPVAAPFVAIGTAMGASAATAGAVGAMTVATGASLGLQGYSMYQQNKAAKSSAALAQATADYNARVDEAEAKQIEMDQTENVRRAREEARIYTSRQKAAYATAGVLSSGSPLAVEAMTAGRIEQRILQDNLSAKRQAEKARAAGRVGRLYGEASASGIMQQNTADLLRGGASMLSTAGSFAFNYGMSRVPTAPVK